MVRKVLLLLMIMFSIACNYAFAANWHWCASNADKGIFFDEESVRYSRFSTTKSMIDYDKITFWAKIVLDDAYSYKHPFNGRYVSAVVEYECIDIRSRQILSIETILYDKKNNRIAQSKRNEGWKNVVPDSMDEVLFRHVKNYVQNHKKVVEGRS